MKTAIKTWLPLLLYSVAYALVMLSLDGIRLYETSPYHRFQAEALLHGHLYLSNSIYAIQPGLAWYDGHVQQVWGLGIGLWLTPFTAVWHLFSNSPLPDRAVLGLAFVLLALFSTQSGLKLIKSGRFSLGLLTILATQFCPALWTLARYSRLVFEETALYSVLFSLAILIALIRVASSESLRDYFVCCALGAFAVWVRPTHAVYGFGAAGIASLVFFVRRKPLWQVAIGLSCCLLSAFLLGLTNWYRFGSPLEFGHRLTISTSSMMYLTRFGNPYRETPIFSASKELFGMLFLANPHGRNVFSDHLFFGQALFTRWRKLDLSTFDLSYVALILIAIFAVAVWLFRRRKRILQQPQGIVVVSLLFWASFSAAGLAFFYLYYPAMASRYLLDFAPAFSAFLVIVPSKFDMRWKKVLVSSIAAWTIFEIAAAKIPVNQPPIPTSVQIALPTSQGVSLGSFNGIYTLENHPIKTAIVGNGHGWDAESGIAANVISLVLDDPQFVELRASPRRSLYGESHKVDVYRAQINGVELPRRAIYDDKDEIRVVVFDVPTNFQNHHQSRLLFICFSTSSETEEWSTECFLQSVHWK
jgi:hypothetical protein